MRRLISIFAVLAASLCASSCNNTVLVKFGDMIYEVTCREQFMMMHGGCTTLVHDINASDGENGAHVTCAVGSIAGSPSLNFNMSGMDMTGQPFQMQLGNVLYNASGTATSGSLSMTEGATLYTGRISGAAPTSTLPCQVTGITQTMDMDMNPQIEGDILCEHLTPSAMPMQIREVEAVSAPDHPFHFRIVFCDGLAMH